MFETLFGAEMAAPVRIFFILLVVVGLIIAVGWIVRKFGGERLGGAAARGRQPRLALIEAAAVGDGRRRLILIRRDNVEHLLLIGGQTDIVVEANIVRATAAHREQAAAPRAPAPAEAPSARQVPLGDASPWPLQPEPVPRPPRIPVAEEPMQWMEPEPAPIPAPPPVRRQPRSADPLAGLAAELSRASESARGPAPLEPDSGSFAPAPRESVRSPREALRQRAAAAAPARPPIAREPMPQPLEEAPEPQPEREAPRLREPQAQAPVAADPAFGPGADQNLAEMAQRLEAALRRPARTNDARPEGTARAPEPDNVQPIPTPARAPVEAAAPPRAEPKPSKSLYDNLEKEMASLLGRPGGKS